MGICSDNLREQYGISHWNGQHIDLLLVTLENNKYAIDVNIPNLLNCTNPMLDKLKQLIYAQQMVGWVVYGCKTTLLLTLRVSSFGRFMPHTTITIINNDLNTQIKQAWWDYIDYVNCQIRTN